MISRAISNLFARGDGKLKQNLPTNVDDTTAKSQRITKNVFVLGLVSFFNDIASEMIYPLVPIFLTTILGAPVALVGLIEGFAESVGSGLKLFAGVISDKLQQRKPFVTAGYSLSTLAKILLGVAYSWPLVLIARFCDRFGKAIRTAARDALITESSTATNRGIAFGFHRALDTLGAVIGPLLAIWFLHSFHNNFNVIFLLAAIPGLIGIILLIFWVGEQKKNPAAIATRRPTGGLLFKWHSFNPTFKFFIVVSCIFAIGNSSDVFLILRAQNLGLSLTLVILSYVSFNLSYALLATPAGMISDRIGPKKVLLLSFGLFALVYLLFGLIDHSKYIWVVFPLYGLYMALSEGVGKAYISNLVAKEEAGTAFGTYQAATSICTLFASIVCVQNSRDYEQALKSAP
jgi:MFS family permease